MNPPKMAAWNLTLRFLLEMAALVGLGALAWDKANGVMRWIGVIAIPLLVAAAWGTFNVADDPSRSGGAPVPVSGWLRLVLELVVLVGGAVAIGMVWGRWWGIATISLIVVHYLGSTSRVGWLIQQ